MRFLLPILLLAYLISPSWMENASAGPNAGGTLLVHTSGLEYAATNDGYCDDLDAQSCETIISRTNATNTIVWWVCAVFSEINNPRLRGVEFSVDYSGIGVVNQHMCGDFEQVNAAWPASGTGAIVVWNTTQTERVTPVYWFAGYAYSAVDGSGPHFSVGPHPTNGGHFGDDSTIPVIDTIAGYGMLGFFIDGEAPCPAPRTFLVRPDGTGDVATIQDAIDIAAPTSVIELADGVYRGEGNTEIHLNQAELVIRSISNDPEACVIDCEGSETQNRRAFRIDWQGDPAERPVTIQGIKVIKGYATRDTYSYDSEGGAIHQGIGSMLRLENCVFENCFSDKAGGAVDCSTASIELIDCVFRENSCSAIGGGGGAGLSAGDSSILMSSCVFDSNRSADKGGAIWITYSTLQLENCIFRANEAEIAGATGIANTNATLTGCSWIGNTASTCGGVTLTDSDVTIERATISDNTGSGGAGIRCLGNTSLDLYNSIISYSILGGSVSCGTATIFVSGSDIFGNAGGDWIGCLSSQRNLRGNFSLDPLYCDRAGSDYHLRRNSPCSVRSDIRRGAIGAWGVGCGEPLPLEHDRVTLGRMELANLQVEKNPFSESTRIEFALQGGDQPVAIEVVVYDLAGRRIRSLLETKGDGSQSVLWNGRDDHGTLVPSGVYFCRVSVGASSETIRLTRLR